MFYDRFSLTSDQTLDSIPSAGKPSGINMPHVIIAIQIISICGVIVSGEI